MKKILVAIGLAVLFVLLIALPVLAAYSANITVVNNSANSYSETPLMLVQDNGYLAANGYIESDGLDVQIEDNGSSIPTMLTDKSTWFVPDNILANSSYIYQWSSGNEPADSMPIIVGNDGYITVPDNPDLEFKGYDYKIEMDGYLKDSAGDIYNKENALVIATDGSNVTADIYRTDLPSYQWSSSIYYNGYIYVLGQYNQLNKINVSNYNSQSMAVSAYPSSEVVPQRYVPMQLVGTNLYIIGYDSMIYTRCIDKVSLSTFADLGTVSYVPTVSDITKAGVIGGSYCYVLSGGTIDKIALSNGANIAHIGTSDFSKDDHNMSVVMMGANGTGYYGGLYVSGSYLYCIANAIYDSHDHVAVAKINISTMALSDVAYYSASGYYSYSPVALLNSGSYLYTVVQDSLTKWNMLDMTFVGQYSTSGLFNTECAVVYGDFIYEGKRTTDTGATPYISAIDISGDPSVEDGATETGGFSIGTICTDGTDVYCMKDNTESYVVLCSDLSEVDNPAMGDITREPIHLEVAYSAGDRNITLEYTVSNHTTTLTVEGDTDTSTLPSSVPDTGDAIIMSNATPYIYYFEETITIISEEPIIYELMYQPETILLTIEDTDTGTATFTNGSATVVGDATSWTANMMGGQIKDDTDGVYYTIQSVSSATSLTLTSVYTQTGEEGAYTLNYYPTATLPDIDETQDGIITFGVNPDLGSTNFVPNEPTITPMVPTGGSYIYGTYSSAPPDMAKIPYNPGGNIAYYSGGMASFTNGSKYVTGNGTLWISTMKGGMIKLDSDDVYYTIASVTSPTNMTLTADYDETGGVGVYHMTYLVGGVNQEDTLQSNNLLTPWFTPWANLSNIPVIAFFLFLGTAVLVGVVVWVMQQTQNQFVGGLIMLTGEAFLYKLGIYELWFVIVTGLICFALIIYERKPAL
jgi:hypothetical protein